MANVSALIKDGKVLNQADPAAKAKAEKNDDKSSAAKQKEQFLSLLVAQMKYQDPLEPTSNTEWISQYSTFASLEAMQNMQGSLEMSRASDMIGKTVTVSSENKETGRTTEVVGLVEYVSYSGSTAYVCIEGQLYKADDVKEVHSDAYTVAKGFAEAFVRAMNELPKLNELTKNDLERLKAVDKAYKAFDKTTKGLIPSEYQSLFIRYKERMKEIAGVNAFDDVEAPKGKSVKPSEETDKIEKTDKPLTGRQSGSDGKPKEGTSPAVP